MLRRFTLIAILFCSANVMSKAQTIVLRTENYSIQFRGTPLKQALQQFVKLTSADLIYDPAFELDHEVYVTAKKVSSKELLSLILEESGYDYIILSSGTYVVVREVRERSRYAPVKGIITDKDTGRPVELASIYIADTGSGTFSNLDGTFTLPELLEGNYTIQINHTGYMPLQVEVDLEQLLTQDQGNLEIEMKPRLYLGDALVVNGSHQPLGINRNSVQNSADLNLYAVQQGTNLLKTTQYFSGVNYDIGSQQLSIQGSGSGDHILTLDGVPVYDPYSVSLITSAFSPYAIDKIQMEKAGFEASAGSQLSGKVNVRQKYSVSGAKRLQLQVEPFSSNLSATTPVNVGETPIQIDVTGRISMQDVIPNQQLSRQLDEWDQLDPLIQNFLMGSDQDIDHYDVAQQQNDFGFYDFHLTAAEKKNDFKETSFSMYFGGSDVRTDLLSERSTFNSMQPTLVYSREDASFQNNLIQLSHTNATRARIEWEAKTYFSSSGYQNQYLMQNTQHFGHTDNTAALFDDLLNKDMEDQSMNRNFIREFGFRGSFNYALNARNRLEVGLNPRYFSYHVQLNDLFYLPTIERSEVFHLAGYAEADSRIRENIRFKAGLRLTSPELDQVFAEPRASLQIDLPTTNIRYSSLKFSGGLYRQFVNRFSVSNVGPSSLIPSYNFWLPVGSNNRIPQALHLAASYKMETETGLNLHTEFFYKDIREGLSLNYPALFNENNAFDAFHDQNNYLQSHSGFARGYALTLSKQFDEVGLMLEGIYERTISEISIDNQFNGNSVPTQWNEPHRIKLFSRWKLGEHWDLISSALWIPIRNRGFRDAYYNFLPQHSNGSFGEFDLNDPAQVNLPAFFNLNTGIQYHRELGESAIKARLDIQNITNRRNVMDFGLNPLLIAPQQIEYERYARRLPGLIPTFSVEFSF